MAKAPVAIKTASVLAFERKLATSDAVMYAGNWQGNEWQPIEIQEKAVRGTISNRLKNAIVSDPTKLDAEIQKANLQRVDVASLPVDTDTLKVVFTLRVLGNLSTPSVCNDMAYQEALSGVIEGYISEHGFKELTLRYALNLANGRFLWRNRIGAEQIQVKVTANETSWTFNSHDFSLRQFDQGQAAVTQLAAIIEQGLSAKEWVMLTVEAQVRLGAGQEVFPSQELVLDSNSSKGLTDYCQCSPVTPVPEIKGWRVVSRVQVKSNSQRLLRRSVKKGWLTEEQAIERLATQAEQRTDLPFLNMKSLSSQQLFKLFIRHGDLLKEPVKGEFSSYGLSATATIPWF
ncbi:TPA: type I-F CRISPR-associated protein Csy3 [Escherichia coli]